MEKHFFTLFFCEQVRGKLFLCQMKSLVAMMREKTLKRFYCMWGCQLTIFKKKNERDMNYGRVEA